MSFVAESLRFVSTGVADLAIQAADFGLDVLGRPDVVDRARVLSAMASRKVALTSSPTPKVKMRVLAVLLAAMFWRILSVLVSPMVGWPSVKKTMVNRAALVVGAIAEGGGHGVVDGGAAGGLQLLHPLLGLGDLLRGGVEKAARVLVHRSGEVDAGEAVLGAEVFQAVLHGLAGLLHLDAAHTARVSSTSTMSRGT